MGAWQEIVDYTVPSNTTSVVLNDFGTITKDDFVKVVTTIINGSSSNTNIALYPNNETTATNYHAQALGGFGSSTAAARSNVSRINFISGNNSSTGIAYVKLSENDRLNIFLNRPTQNDSGLNLFFDYTTSSGVTFSSGITSLTFTAEVTNGLGTGSRIQIYKLAAEKVADITVASNTTQVDISSLSIDKDSEYLLVSDLIGNTGIALFVNDNTTETDYYVQRIEGEGSTAAAERFNIPVFNSRAVAYTHIKLSNIGAYTYQSYTLRDSGTTTPVLNNWFGSSTSEAITSITKINIKTTSATQIGSGSRFTLYKLYE